MLVAEDAQQAGHLGGDQECAGVRVFTVEASGEIGGKRACHLAQSLPDAWTVRRSHERCVHRQHPGVGLAQDEDCDPLTEGVERAVELTFEVVRNRSGFQEQRFLRPEMPDDQGRIDSGNFGDGAN